ncbi:MAG TPA: aminoglycoside phosphotransferase family protein [Micromonosporaceae bacterium]|nr:aminoglycoside phosphotransferase family protein [Micromonosporaceae bacterium]
MPRIVTLVLVDGAGTPLGVLPPYEVAEPWWQDVVGVVAGARDRYGIEVTVLRLLGAQLPAPHGGAVTYLAECGTGPPAQAVPFDAARLGPGTHPLGEHPLRALWARPGGPAASLAWAAGQLARLGWQPSSATQQRTWNLSAIWRLDGPSGTAWLKQVPPFFAHEPAVLRWLGTVAPGRVPPVLAADEGTGRTLLAHAAGEDRYLAPPAELAALVDDLHLIQRQAVGQVRLLLAAGVPDRRWPALMGKVRDTVARHGPGLGPELAAALRALVDGLDARLAAVDECGLPDTLGHGDFHAGNARGDGSDRTLIDWGDSFVGHPGFDALRIVEQQPPPVAAQLLRHWARRWRDSAPGCQPERALDLLAPVAALSMAATYAGFVSAIEPSERPYHATDIGIALRAAVTA